MDLLSMIAQGFFDLCFYTPLIVTLCILSLALPLRWSDMNEAARQRALRVTIGLCVFTFLCLLTEYFAGAWVLMIALAPIALLVILIAVIALPVAAIALPISISVCAARLDRGLNDIHEIRDKY